MFERIVEEVVFKSPLTGFELDRQGLEHRKDPLTGRWSRVNIKRSRRVKQAAGELDIDELVRRSREKCFFCPENIESSTPRFHPDIVPEGRLRRGETWVFPNLFPFARHHAVATITKAHFLRSGDFSREMIENTVLASLDYIRLISEKDEATLYPTFNWNHLFPSGASIIHPHVQITLDSRPTYMTERLFEANREYLNRFGRSYWTHLVAEEKKRDERFISEEEGITYLASYSPLGNNEVLMVFHNKTGLLDLDENDAAALASGIERLLKGYSKRGIESFNLSTYSGPIEGDPDGFNLHMRLVSRSSPSAYYTSDVGFMEGLHFERVVESLPEDLAKDMKTQFIRL